MVVESRVVLADRRMISIVFYVFTESVSGSLLMAEGDWGAGGIDIRRIVVVEIDRE